MKIYLSGYLGKAGVEDWFNRQFNLRHRCVSFAYCGPDSPRYNRILDEIIETCTAHRVGMFLDSGAFTFFATKDLESIDTFAKKYVAYVKATPGKWDFYVNFDYVKDAPVVWAMQKRLEKAGIQPCPVFHGDDGFKWLHRYIDAGYDRIMIGRVEALGSDAIRRYYDGVFNITEPRNIKCHGLMVTGRNMWRYPWDSVDSATWLKLAAYGNVIMFDQGRRQIRTLRVTTPLRDHEKRALRAYGGLYTLKALQSHYKWRAAWNAYEFLKVSDGHAKNKENRIKWHPLV